MDKRMTPDYETNHGERASLFATTVTPGFDVLQHIMGSVCLKFQEKHMLTNPGTAEATQAHYMAKAAAQFYETVISRVNHELLLYTNAPKAGDAPEDPTDVLDMGEISSAFDGMPNLLGDVTLEEDSQ